MGGATEWCGRLVMLCDRVWAGLHSGRHRDKNWQALSTVRSASQPCRPTLSSRTVHPLL